jgi:hypothetical protein
MELPGQSLILCVHGEQSATNNVWLHGETGLTALAINATPCGYCRQFLNELTTANGLKILLRKTKNPLDYSHTTKPFPFYLPDAFGPQDRGDWKQNQSTFRHGDRSFRRRSRRRSRVPAHVRDGLRYALTGVGRRIHRKKQRSRRRGLLFLSATPKYA